MSTTTRSKPVIDKVESFVETLRDPIMEVARFYTYYTLAELHDNPQFKPDFEKVRSKQYKDIYNYGIYAISRELRHIWGSFNIRLKEDIEQRREDFSERGKGDRITKPNVLLEAGVVSDLSGMFSRFDEYLRTKRIKEITPEIHKSDDLISNMEEVFKQMVKIQRQGEIPNRFDTEEQITEFMVEMEKRLSVYTRPEKFIKASKHLFKLPDWETHYGGQKWADVCSLLLKHNDNKTMWVDMAWNTQHNNAVFLNKVEPQWLRVDTIRDINKRNERKDREDIRNIVEPIGPRNVWKRVIPRLLDMRREGELIVLFQLAGKFDDRVSRYTRVLEGY